MDLYENQDLNMDMNKNIYLYESQIIENKPEDKEKDKTEKNR
jgi:hypothetical protein